MTSPPPDPALLRGLTRSRLGGPRPTRRQVFRAAGLSAAALALSACSIPGRKAAATPEKDPVASYWAGKKRNGVLRWANWPLYIDKDGKRYPTIEAFTKDTGIQVTYQEAIQEMPTWFGKIQPQLGAGQDIGFDLMVMTNSLQLTKAMELGYLAPIDHSELPNFAANVGAKFKNPAYDPGNAYTVPWQSGLTGIAYNPKYVDGEITSIEELWNPRYKGKVGMMSDSQELGNFGMFAAGVDPDKSGKTDWEKAAKRLQEQRDAGLVRKYYENDYVDALARGDVWLTMAWSGDIYQQIAEGRDLKFVVPQEGGSIWTDNMCIPVTARNPVDALALMDYVYRPPIAAALAEYITYITPVPSTRDIVRQEAAAATGEDKEALELMANSPLIYPSDADLARTRSFRTLSDAEEKVYEGIFQPISQG